MKEESKSRVAEGVQDGVSRSRSRPASVLTVDAAGAVAERDQEDVVWHELMNAQRTRKILSGALSGIERLDGGWVVARFSGTEPLLRVFCEMDTMDKAAQAAACMERFLGLTGRNIE